MAEDTEMESAAAALEKTRDVQAKKVAQLVEELSKERARLAQIDSGLAGLREELDPDDFRDDYRNLGILAATEQLLTERGEDMETGDIARIIKARGVVSKSIRFVPTVYATLNNATHLFVRRRGKWGLKKT